MQKGDHLFVYGTLRRGERASLCSSVHGKNVRFCGSDAITAMMYHIGSYPGVKLIPDVFDYQPKLPCVQGEVFRILHPSVIAFTDAYEGYESDHPEQGHYNRFEVKTKDGLSVWVYTYNPPVFSEQLIESGDWCKASVMIRRGLRG